MASLEQFEGCLLGSAVGDAFGAPFEGMPADAIYYTFGSAHRILRQPPVETLCYTDDTQMMIGVAESLLGPDGLDEASLVQAFARNFDADRGYGQGARKLIEAVIRGEPWEALATAQFPGGSLGNGAAMRVAPIGLLYRDDLDRVAFEAARSAWPTHRHPIGIEGARLIAVSVAIASRQEPFDRAKFFNELLRFVATEEFHGQLERAAAMSADDAVAPLGGTLEAHRSVVTAIACYAGDPDSYPNVITRALTVGDDVDTLAAMAGAISGARLGIAAVPVHLLGRLENGRQGRDYVKDLACRLHRLYVSSRRPA